MNKQDKHTPDPKPELFKQKKHYCWLTGYRNDPADWNRNSSTIEVYKTKQYQRT